MEKSAPIVENGGYRTALETARPRTRFCCAAALILAPWTAFAFLGPQENGSLLAEPWARAAAWISLGLLCVLLALGGFFRLTEKPREKTVLVPRGSQRF